MKLVYKAFGFKNCPKNSVAAAAVFKLLILWRSLKPCDYSSFVDYILSLSSVIFLHFSHKI
jgi:hypothetical protein